MAHTKAAGAAKRTVNVAGKRLGIKIFGGSFAKSGSIIVRQRGTVFHPGKGTSIGRDHTIFATTDGYVDFRRMTGHKRSKKYIDILPEPRVEATETKAEAKPKAVAKKTVAKADAPKVKKTTKKASATKTTKKTTAKKTAAKSSKKSA